MGLSTGSGRLRLSRNVTSLLRSRKLDRIENNFFTLHNIDVGLCDFRVRDIASLPNHDRWAYHMACLEQGPWMMDLVLEISRDSIIYLFIYY